MKPLTHKFKVAKILLAASLAFALGACSSPTTNPTQSAGDTVEIGVSEINLSLAFYVQMQEASQKVAADYGANVTWQSADGSIEKQISTIESFIAQKKDVILIDPTNAEALVDVVNRATDAGIHVITMGNKVKGTANHNTLYPDYDNFANQARVLGKKLGGKGKVLFLIGSVGNYVSDTRQAGFEDTMKKEFPGIQVITQPTDWDGTKAGSVTQTVLTNNSDLAGVASVSDGLTLSALKVLEKAGKSLPVVSCDGDEQVFPYIDSGAVLTDILSGAYRVGAWNTAVAVRLARGASFDTDLFMPTYTVASEATAGQISGWGLGIETVTTAKAKEVAQAYQEEFGPSRSDSDMSVK